MSVLIFNRMRGPTKICWGEATMIQAEIILLRHTLMDPSNERFAFISDSCILLYNFNYTYDYIMSTSTSFVDSFADTKEGRYNRKMDPVINVNHWRKGSQWVVLTRKHVEIIVKDEVVFPMFQQHCQENLFTQKLLGVCDLLHPRLRLQEFLPICNVSQEFVIATEKEPDQVLA